MMTLTTGAKLGRYEIRAPLGAGGMGEVYLARDTELDRTVAIKILPAAVASDQQRLQRFIQEAKAASALNHPHILTIYEIGGMFDEAVELNQKALQIHPNNQLVIQALAYSYARGGRRREAEEVLDKLKDIAKGQYVSPYQIARIRAALGDKDLAFAELEKAYEERDWFLPQLKVEPALDGLRDNPRFQDLLRRVGLPQ